VSHLLSLLQLMSIVAVCRLMGNLLGQEASIEENKLFCLLPPPISYTSLEGPKLGQRESLGVLSDEALK
jgi:hypothetical protein